MADTSADSHRLLQINEDDWHGVSDARIRKKIQDKLAQRARRKRLREAKEGIKHGSCDTQIVHYAKANTHCHHASDAVAGLAPLDASDRNSYSYSAEIKLQPSPSRSLSPCHSLFGQVPSLSHELPYPLTVFAALFINGEILGLSCSACVATKSKPASPDVPLPLQPTAIQLLTIHFTGIDRFPFPKFRDNAIKMSAIIDEEEVMRDLFTKPSFTIAPGATSWDPRGWTIEKPFADKWGFLFY